MPTAVQFHRHHTFNAVFGYVLRCSLVEQFYKSDKHFSFIFIL